MSYEVFARKYRPQTFDDLVGQAHVSRTLKNAVTQNRLAHAYLFVGPRGIGKTSTARILAKALNCVNGPTVTPDNTCDNCKEIAAGNSLDVLEIDGASNNGVEQVRELRENVRYAPSKSRYKIYIIDEVHMLTAAAFNALLKTLEEPPPHVKFIFATTEPQKVLPTIVSRCQRFDLHRIPAKLIADHLQFIAKKEKITLEPAAAHAIARGAEGGMRDAESMLDQLVAFCGEKISESDVLNVFGFTSEQSVVDLTGKVFRRETAAALDVLYEQSEAGKDMMRLMSDLISYLRDLLVFKAKPDALKEDVDPEIQKALATQSDLIENERLLELIDQFAQAEGRMKWAPNKKLHFEVAIIKAIQSLGQATLDEVIEKLGELRDGSPRKEPVRTADKTTTAEKKTLSVEQTASSSVAASASAARTVSPATSSVAAGVSPAIFSKAADPPPPNASPARTYGATSTAAATATRVAETANGETDVDKIWQNAFARIPNTKAFVRNSAAVAQVLPSEGRHFVLGFSPDKKSPMDILGTATNRKLIESLLQDVSGRDWTLKLIMRDDLPDKQNQLEDYADNPLIREAIEIFKGEIKR
ncbi:MAG TPA: DNA polymerase III subunit gamma/tau [Chthoniobacterales bacterium]|nr:DNA polymerase III subunit gamma/tau [Chthoniobacterales bacterium]